MTEVVNNPSGQPQKVDNDHPNGPDASTVNITEVSRLARLAQELYADYGIKGQISRVGIEHLKDDPAGAQYILGAFHDRLSSKAKETLRGYIQPKP